MRIVKLLVIGMIFFGMNNNFVLGKETTRLSKLQRGVTNIITSPIELPKQTQKYYYEGRSLTPHFIVWVVCGMIIGSVETVKRAGSGIYDVMTFAGNQRSLVNPENVFDQWPQRPEGAWPKHTK